jgi:hypothetical protein
MGNRTYLRHGRQSQAETAVERLQGSLLQIDMSEIVVHEGQRPVNHTHGTPTLRNTPKLDQPEDRAQAPEITRGKY